MHDDGVEVLRLDEDLRDQRRDGDRAQIRVASSSSPRHHRRMGSTSSRAVVGVFVLSSLMACEPPRESGGFDPIDCVVDDDPAPSSTTQGLIRLPPSAIEVFLEEDSGGPLRCRPSGQPCPALEGCVGAPVQVPVGTEVTLAVGLRTLDYQIRPTIEAVTLAGDPAFRLLEPTPDVVEAEPVFIFVAVTAPTAGVISAQLAIVSDARNTETEPLRITVQVEGVQP
jgi:hypothetical protein